MEKIKQALDKAFEKHRIVFWYDAKKELRSDFEALDLPNVEKVELNNNEFGVKYRILREQPQQKFLLYHEGPQPADLDNWLLDVLLAHHEFRTERIAIWLSELDLGSEFSDIASEHQYFFNAAKRREGLKRLRRDDDTPGKIRMKMMAVCVSAEPRIDSILESLLKELSEEQDEKFKLIKRCNLEGFLWNQLKLNYGYESDFPSIFDFSVELLKSCYSLGLGEGAKLSSEAVFFLSRWKDSKQYYRAFEIISKQHADNLNIKHDLEQRSFEDLLDLDYFELIDQKIISDLIKGIVDKTISAKDCEAAIQKRRLCHWYDNFVDVYEAISCGVQFLHLLEGTNLSMTSMAEGIQNYANCWFELDQLYRKYIYHTRKSGQTSLLERLSDRIEGLYSNNYLLQVNNNWQQLVDACVKWEAAPITNQRDFFEHRVYPFLTNRKKVFIVVSDALRFESGEELLTLIRKEDRYDAEIKPMLAMIPSYTQLGMASLLPNKEIAFVDDETGTVLVNGHSTQGTKNRAKILGDAISGSATAMNADELLGMNREECRTLFREHDVVYVYHNRIDSTGDKKESEGRVFEAVEETLKELIQVIKKLTAANVTNLLVTSDHGFIYQNHVIDESDFLVAEPSGEQLLYRDRRFILGKGLAANPGLKKFTSADIGLTGDMEIQIPKSINRLRLKGSGSRYVHGGASLQEVVVPVIEINKKRQSDITTVEVDILNGGSRTITAGQLSVAFYQKDPVTEKVQARTLRVGIYAQSGEPISDIKELIFDRASENAREREFKVRFVMTRASEKFNNQDVYLKLEEQLPGTSHYREYKSVRYLLRRSFTSDFDF